MRAEPRRRRRLAAAGLLLATLTGCTGPAGDSTPPDPTTDSAASPGLRYAALGDSFTAAPYVPVTDIAGGCLRSDSNYPSLVAERLELDLVDVSCSGADTRAVIQPQRIPFSEGSIPPQIEAVTGDTDLVTIGLGGNDENLFASLVRRCTVLAPETAQSCPAELRDAYDDPDAVLRATGRRVAKVVAQVRERARQATVVVVGYPRLVDPALTCDALPAPTAALREVDRLERLLNAALRSAARRTGAEFVDVRALSRDHAICAQDPWVNGPFTDQERALAFHPFAMEQEAVAEEVARLAEDLVESPTP